MLDWTTKTRGKGERDRAGREQGFAQSSEVELFGASLLGEIALAKVDHRAAIVAHLEDGGGRGEREGRLRLFGIGDARGGQRSQSMERAHGQAQMFFDHSREPGEQGGAAGQIDGTQVMVR